LARRWRVYLWAFCFYYEVTATKRSTIKIAIPFCSESKRLAEAFDKLINTSPLYPNAAFQRRAHATPLIINAQARPLQALGRRRIS
jgi:hypothetical protein